MPAFNYETEKEFKANFVSTFLATWVANHYDRACAEGRHDTLEKPPVEDAEFLADKAWRHYEEIVL